MILICPKNKAAALERGNLLALHFYFFPPLFFNPASVLGNVMPARQYSLGESSVHIYLSTQRIHSAPGFTEISLGARHVY